MRKALPLTGAEQYDLGTQNGQLLEMRCIEEVEALDGPGLDGLRRDDHAAGVTNPVDLDKAGTVGGDGVLRSRCIGVKLQIAVAKYLTKRAEETFEYIIGTHL